MTSQNNHRNKWLIVIIGFLILLVFLLPLVASQMDTSVASVNWSGDGNARGATEIVVNWGSRLPGKPHGGGGTGHLEVAVNWASGPSTLSSSRSSTLVNWGS